MSHIDWITRRLAPVLAPALVVAAIGCREEATSPSAPELEPALDVSQAQALSFRQVSLGFFHTCGVTTGDVAYCWGLNSDGQFGDGTTTDSPSPVAVAGGLRFRQVSAGTFHTCGLASNNLTYCWGSNFEGQLGDGTTTNHLAPTRVHAGGLRFMRVTVGGSSSCGVTSDNRAFCWGSNSQGQLGDGTLTDRLTPVAVGGGLRFRQVVAGQQYTCGVTPLDVAYCWGDNRGGQLGIGTNTGPETCQFDVCSTSPVAVAGGLRFRSVNGTDTHTCGVTTDNVAYCWGFNQFGRLGNGTFNRSSFMPSKVRGGIRFRAVTAGVSHTCGLTPDDLAYCWGMGGILGDDRLVDRRLPVPVTGGLLFRQVDAHVVRTCGVTTGNRVYCWGRVPVLVPGQ